jgi:23S rRNA (guanosine2251-2'-O)-methyltransferase
LISERESAPITPTAIKISSGALEHLPVAKASSFSQAFEKLKASGFWIVGTDMDEEQIYTDYDFIRPVVIVIGSEGKGLRPSTRKHCDDLVKIPIKGNVESLNASVSAGIVLYEALRQRGDFKEVDLRSRNTRD